MKLVLLYLTAGTIVGVAGFHHHPALTVLASLAVLAVVYAAWLHGHQQGWNHRCTATAGLHDALTEQAERS